MWFDFSTSELWFFFILYDSDRLSRNKCISRNKSTKIFSGITKNPLWKQHRNTKTLNILADDDYCFHRCRRFSNRNIFMHSIFVMCPLNSNSNTCSSMKSTGSLLLPILLIWYTLIVNLRMEFFFLNSDMK